MKTIIDRAKLKVSRKSDKPSRFLLELKEQIEDLSERESKKSQKESWGLTFLEKVKCFFNKKRKSKKVAFFIDEKKKDHLSRTSFFPILKIFYSIFKVVIWVFLFLARFFYFGTKKVINPGKTEIFKKINLKTFLDKDSDDSTFIPKNKVLGNIKEEEKDKGLFRSRKKEKAGLFQNFKLFFRLRYLKNALFFSLFLVIVSLPFKFVDSLSGFSISEKKGMVMGASEEALSNLLNASQAASSLDVAQAHSSLVRAGDDLLSIKIELEKINNSLFFLASFAPSQNIRLASESKKIIEAGIIGTEIANHFSSAIAVFTEEDKKLTDKISIFKENLAVVEKNINDLEEILASVSSRAVPDEYFDHVATMKESIAFSKPILSEIIDFSDKAMIFLGANEDKRYLFIFQNNTELRASGGFIGSYALVDFSSGEIKKIDVPGGGSYDTEAGLRDFIVSPEPLHLIKPRWFFWDANWWPDFKKTAEKLMWFLEKSDGPSVDGVISMTPTVIEDILKLIGPIDMRDDYDLVINSENFWIETQNLAEQKPDVTKKPKKIIGDLMDKMIEELPHRIDKDNIFDLAQVLLKTLKQKHIIFYFNDEELQKKVREYSWSGEMEKTLYDYLMIVNTNVAGGKSDRDMTQEIYHKVKVADDGTIYTTVTVRREHKGKKGDMFSGVRNNSWMRFYVPQGSELIEANGFLPIEEEHFKKTEDFWEIDVDLIAEREAIIDAKSGTKIYNELGKTVFANWAWVDPGEKIEVSIKYKLPFKLNFDKKQEDNFFDNLLGIFKNNNDKLAPYSLMIQKQPGTKNDVLNTSLIFSGNEEILWSYGSGSIGDKGWNMKGFLDSDKYWAVLIEN